MVASKFETRLAKNLARSARENVLRMVHAAKASHVGSALSVVDILAVLYGDVMNTRPDQPDWDLRDRLILSKGHAGVALYAVLGELGFFPKSEFSTYGKDGARLMGHASHYVPGVELSTGSLGHGLPVGCGLALGLRDGQRVFVVLSDGELDEGSNWEAILFAGHHRLNRLTAVIDYNRIQSLGSVSDVLELEPLDRKFEAFGWRVLVVDGHDHHALKSAFVDNDESRPTVVVAKTVKGHGVDFMENQLAWHYKSLSDAELETALCQVAK